jgi:hypothetical protein
VKRNIPLAIVMVGGILMIIQYFIPHQYSQAVFDTYTEWGPIVGVFALILGIGSLIRVHSHKIKRRAKNWQYSYAVLIPLLAMPLFGLILPVLGGGAQGTRYIQCEECGSFLEESELEVQPPCGICNYAYYAYEPPAMLNFLFRNIQVPMQTPIIFDSWVQETRTILLSSGGVDPPSVFDFLFMHIQVPIQATMFSLLAFYIASAAFRAFRAKSALATVLLIAAVIVMMGQVPIGELFGSWFPKVGQWILRYPNAAAKRAIALGVGFGILATQLKIIFGVERNWLGGAGE